MEKITTTELIKALKRNLLAIFLVTLAFALVGFIYSRVFKGKEYKAQTVMIIVGDDKSEVSYNKLLLNEKLSNIYSEILTSEDIYKDVIKDLDLKGINPADLRDSLESEVNAQAGIISFELTSKNSDKAKDILSSICEKFKEYVKTYLNIDNLDYLQEVSVKEDTSGNTFKYTGVGLILGFLLSVLFVCLKEVNSQKIKDESYLRELDIEVLGVIEDEK